MYHATNITGREDPLTSVLLLWVHECRDLEIVWNH